MPAHPTVGTDEPSIARVYDALLEPGLVAVDDWWPSGPRVGDPNPGARFGLVGVARKP